MKQRQPRFISRQEAAERFAGKRVAIVGSGPGVLENTRGFIDSHDVVVRVNNYKLFHATGFRTDVHYSYYGNAIKKSVDDLIADGVALCMCKCPDAKFMESAWHEAHDKTTGIDFRWIYRNREKFWFCDTYVPSVQEFVDHFNLLGGHVPTTGFASILDVLSFGPQCIYLTGFDFFSSGRHNVNESWAPGNPDDPIGHVPHAEARWLADNIEHLPIICDQRLMHAIREVQLGRFAVPVSRKPVPVNAQARRRLRVHSANSPKVLPRERAGRRVRRLAVTRRDRD